MTTTSMIRPDVLAWLHSWQTEIQQQNFDSAAHRFSEDVHSFGTVMPSVETKAELIQLQWRAVWTRTQGFRFLIDTLHAWGDSHQQVLATQWVSEGLDANDGTPFTRLGRATIVLQRHAEEWIATHTHFSIHPSPERFQPTAEPTVGS